jgi:hypothetical protein
VALVDLARHLARAYEQLHGIDRENALARIREGMESEWSEDTCPERLGGLYPTDAAAEPDAAADKARKGGLGNSYSGKSGPCR